MARKSGKQIVVLASGVFDLIHLGHVRFLEEAKRAGGPNAWLVVVVARDSTVEKMKGKKSIVSEDQRRALVESLRVVDEAVLGYESLEIGEIIVQLKPDVIALGYDQADMDQQVHTYVAAHHLPVRIVRIGKFKENSLDSSSKIKQKIIDRLSS
jgi:FAD synthetase